MVSNVWHVRFAPASKYLSPADVNRIGRLSCEPSTSRRQTKSKSGCQECRLRRVKCDESYPVCRHCNRRGVVCRPAPPKTSWKLEIPLLIRHACSNGTTASMLLQYYFERVCHIMVLDPEKNPLALPLLGYFKESSALMHVVQSIAAVHKDGFRAKISKECLLERKQTLHSIQEEIFNAKKHPVPSFLAVFLLGISSPWIEGTAGLEHLVGARAIFDSILGCPTTNVSDPAIQLIVGLYLWWEMAASFQLHPKLHQSLNTATLRHAVQINREQFHPLAGYSLELFLILANLNHYCRRVVDGQGRDYILEFLLEQQMISWTPKRDDELLFHLSDAYRQHGLIQLRRICSLYPGQSVDEHENMIQGWANEGMSNLLQIPLTSSYLTFLPVPLLSIASEIPESETSQREAVRARFRVLYSLTSLPVMLDAIELVEEIWQLRKSGKTESWHVLLLERGQIFSLA